MWLVTVRRRVVRHEVCEPGFLDLRENGLPPRATRGARPGGALDPVGFELVFHCWHGWWLASNRPGFQQSDEAEFGIAAKNRYGLCRCARCGKVQRYLYGT